MAYAQKVRGTPRRPECMQQRYCQQLPAVFQQKCRQARRVAADLASPAPRSLCHWTD